MTTVMVTIMSLRIHQQQAVVGYISSGLFILTAGSKYALRCFIMFVQQIHNVC